MKLTGKQQRFCDEYLIDLNATQAAIRAGYSAKTACAIGVENLRKPLITEYLSSRQSSRAERTKINADYVLHRLHDIDCMDVLDILNDDGSMKPIKDWPKVWRQSLSGIDVSEIFAGSGDDKVVAGVLKKIKWPDTTKNLELLGRHVNIGAFKESVDHNHKFTGPDGKPFNYVIVTNYVKPGDVKPKEESNG